MTDTNDIDPRDTKEILESILERLDQLEKVLNRLYTNTPVGTEPVPFPLPYFPPQGKVTCPKCGLDWSGAMGYVCSSSDCPMQMNVTC
jgi:hypothetical protein